ncbi:hypothetical protein PP7435_CHR2-0190 [Komagataella phaffii CBS 7435]|uniref:RecQ mediated genome instability protein 1 OB-fold domain-containing protein n=2 Tax=Komagataella phaffii TaxID=460519 RepID=C4R2L5_KOMPG|nr:Hypothetical protein PAS_chr2-2_0181 [Komagataella phaffii GS115]AOA62149.1 GQ67_01158T0 [Komagataella phaffii]CAH2447706.1 hypothetical protein BQ9382_C2-1050 [Komagataella phaffii CBS 7435]AOA68089.1 GQ68_00231T0 [Komagataella phaffii GS115]CAY69739.1 Hypothetical protein PAS_chr2-2_0181 [Komagataella phaffii GS115]CCA37887.1 hypothetical protein PP7435_CHR2-0190 [Komagataella phaffii CBS 7435]
MLKFDITKVKPPNVSPNIENALNSSINSDASVVSNPTMVQIIDIHDVTVSNQSQRNILINSMDENQGFADQHRNRRQVIKSIETDSPTDSPDQDSNEFKSSIYENKVFKLTFQDSSKKLIYGINLEPISNSIKDMKLGTKLILKNTPIRHGCLLLSKDTMIVLPNSHIDEWNYNRDQLKLDYLNQRLGLPVDK